MTIKDHALYKRYMEEIPKSNGYAIFPNNSLVGLEDEMEDLFTWFASVDVSRAFAIGKVKSIPG